MNLIKNNTDIFGFTHLDRKEMQDVFTQYPEIDQVLLFGSRAKGNFKPASDIDLALMYTTDDPHIASTVRAMLDAETSIPYFFDVLDLKNISSEELKEHIQQYGVEIYRK